MTKLCEAIRSSAHVQDAEICIGPIVIFSLPTGEQGNPKRTLRTSVRGLSRMICEVVEDQPDQVITFLTTMHDLCTNVGGVVMRRDMTR